jgi:hypothetical protein
MTSKMQFVDFNNGLPSPAGRGDYTETENDDFAQRSAYLCRGKAAERESLVS